MNHRQFLTSVLLCASLCTSAHAITIKHQDTNQQGWPNDYYDVYVGYAKSTQDVTKNCENSSEEHGFKVWGFRYDYQLETGYVVPETANKKLCIVAEYCLPSPVAIKCHEYNRMKPVNNDPKCVVTITKDGPTASSECGW